MNGSKTTPIYMLPKRDSAQLQRHTLSQCERMKNYQLCPESIEPCVFEKVGHLLKKIQDTGNIVHRAMMPQSPSK